MLVVPPERYAGPQCVDHKSSTNDHHNDPSPDRPEGECKGVSSGHGQETHQEDRHPPHGRPDKRPQVTEDLVLEEEGFAPVVKDGHSDGSCEKSDSEIHEDNVSVDDSGDISLLLTEVGQSKQVSNRSKQEAEKAEDSEEVVDVRVVGYWDGGAGW